jgi:hypothetical protein
MLRILTRTTVSDINGIRKETGGIIHSIQSSHPDVNVIKPFSSSLSMRQNKVQCLQPAITFQFSITFDGNNRSLPIRKHLKGVPIGSALALPSNSKT